MGEEFNETVSSATILSIKAVFLLLSYFPLTKNKTKLQLCIWTLTESHLSSMGCGK